ncbi:MAG: flotillin domain-containing protein [Terrestrivirus sp.]|uniref:Flotillin domain-containing protein n=1 Tax=Terrestrivirus sp. TaxID=2487775 RepID=A0A3G4ZP37_9VIRU|nr:MAG: flotillin domain-containing protein [Terrestrivirus sp.]
MGVGKSTSVLPSLHYNRNDHNGEGSPTGVRHYSSSSSSVLDLLATPAGATVGLTGLAAAGTMGWLLTRYKVARPNEYLVRTGPFLKDDIDISKQAFWLPYQTLTRIDLKPDPYHCEINSMSSEKIEIMLPTNFTIGPKDNETDLKAYAKYMHNSSQEERQTKVVGIIHGETRACINKMSMEELFSDKDKFKKTIVDEINDKLKAFGLVTYTTNFGDMCDKKGNVYFEHMKTKALEGAISTAKIATADKKSQGDIGEKKHVTEARVQVAGYEKDATLAENDRQREISSSVKDLDIAKVEFQKQVNLAKYQAEAEAEKEKLKWQKEVEFFRNQQEIEKLRADQLAKANVNAEVLIKQSEAKRQAMEIEATAYANATRTKAEANAYQIEKDAAANAFKTKQEGEAKSVAQKLLAEAKFIEDQNTANGIKLLREAESEGLNKLIVSAGGVDKLNSYLMTRDNVLPQLAKEQALALRDMRPTVTVNEWNTGSNNGEGSTTGEALGKVVGDLLRTSMPALDAVKKQTGYDLLANFKQSS